MALSTDYRVMSATAQVGLPEAKLGRFPGFRWHRAPAAPDRRRQCDRMDRRRRAAEAGGGAESTRGRRGGGEMGRANVGTPVTNAHPVCRLLLEKKKVTSTKH